MDHNKWNKLAKIFGWVSLILIATVPFSNNLPISGDVIFAVWFIAFFLITFLGVANKTTVQKNPLTGEWKEVTIKKSAGEVAAEIQRAEEEARKKHKLRQKNLSERKQRQIREQQQKEKRKIDASKIEGAGLMAKVKRLKKLYINGTLTKSEFEKAKNKLLK